MIILIPQAPKPLHRPRFTRKGHVYNNQIDEMKKVSYIIKAQWLKYSQQPPIIIDKPISLDVIFFMPIPKRYKSAKSRLKLEGTPHIKTPDIDNILKYLCDEIVLSGIISDDRLICSINAKKLYSTTPRTEFSITLYGE